MSYYCHLSSPTSINDTNLQLYSLLQGANDWNDLVSLIEKGEVGGVDHLKERLVFILSCFGLSLTQLLGQNIPSPDKDKIDHPKNLLDDILARSNIEKRRRDYLKGTFHDFLGYYDTLRHFGKNRNEQKYRQIDELTMKELKRFRDMTIEIWNVVIAMYKNDDENDLGGITSVTEVVWFYDLPEQSG
jgi:hypothetical protein